MARFGRRGDAVYVVSVVSVAHFLSHVFLLAFPPLFPLLGRAFGVSTARLGLLVTAIYVPTLLFQVPLGEVVDRIGARRVLATGIAVTAAGIALAGAAPSYPVLLGCAFLSGIGQSAFHPADYAFLDAVTDESTEGRAFGAHTFGGFAGFAAAPVLVGGVGLAAGWRLALAAVGLVGLGFAAFVRLSTAPVHARTIDRDPGGGAGAAVREGVEAVLSFAGRRGPLLVFGFYLTSMMAITGLQSFTTVLAVDALGFGEAAANALLTAHLAATAVGVVAGGPVADRLPVRGVLAATLLASAAAVWALVALGPSGIVAVGALLSVAGLAIGVALPSRDRLGNAVADPGAAGKSFGFYFTGLSLGAVVSPALLGTVIDRSSPEVAFLLVGGFLVAAVAVVAVARAADLGP